MAPQQSNINKKYKPYYKQNFKVKDKVKVIKTNMIYHASTVMRSLNAIV